MALMCILIAVISYLIGSISFSIIFSKKMAGIDVRTKGSGNAGTTNVLRSVGKKAALYTLICDILKGIVAIGIALAIGQIFNADNRSLFVQIAGISVVIGHTFPIFFGFKGGKGVATALGVLIMTNWMIGLICLAVGITLICLTKMVSVGSCVAAIVFSILAFFIKDHYIAMQGSGYFIYSVVMAVIVLFNHRSNLVRLAQGKENKISFKSSKK